MDLIKQLRKLASSLKKAQPAPELKEQDILIGEMADNFEKSNYKRIMEVLTFLKIDPKDLIVDLITEANKEINDLTPEALQDFYKEFFNKDQGDMERQEVLKDIAADIEKTSDDKIFDALYDAFASTYLDSKVMGSVFDIHEEAILKQVEEKAAELTEDKLKQIT